MNLWVRETATWHIHEAWGEEEGDDWDEVFSVCDRQLKVPRDKEHQMMLDAGEMPRNALVCITCGPLCGETF